MSHDEKTAPARPSAASRSVLAGNEREDNQAIREPQAAPRSSAGPAPFRIATFTNDDPDAPDSERCVAHVFGPDGRLWVPTQYGPTPEWCRERLTRFLTDHMGREIERNRLPGGAAAPISDAKRAALAKATEAARRRRKDGGDA
jgi:hypothetical protein